MEDQGHTKTRDRDMKDSNNNHKDFIEASWKKLHKPSKTLDYSIEPNMWCNIHGDATQNPYWKSKLPLDLVTVTRSACLLFL